eukprot:1159333-Pelagomonas_calceolata.AAC.1
MSVSLDIGVVPQFVTEQSDPSHRLPKTLIGCWIQDESDHCDHTSKLAVVQARQMKVGKRGSWSKRMVAMKLVTIHTTPSPFRPV